MIEIWTRAVLACAAASFALYLAIAYARLLARATELHCVAHGGPNGGHVRFDIFGAEKLNSLSGPLLPVERDVSAGKRIEFTVIYEGTAPSAAA